MSEASRKSRLGRIEWMDLTVPDASQVSEFYSQVVGWSRSEVPVADYQDYCVGPDGENIVAGICHARGENAGLPAAWLIYINVDDIDASLQAVAAAGGKVHGEVRTLSGHGRCCLIEDPAGAKCMLFEPEAKSED
ncbi:MAG: VOC family protein [Planctomycetota bacterium]